MKGSKGEQGQSGQPGPPGKIVNDIVLSRDLNICIIVLECGRESRAPLDHQEVQGLQVSMVKTVIQV
jgi:hypothetical protein